MSNQELTFSRYIWLIGCTACFILPILVSPLSDSHDLLHDAIEGMTFAMFVLSFPGSLLFTLVAAIFFLMFSPFDLPVATYLLLWFGFFVTGYVQWFWAFPELFQKRQLISLGLSRCEEITVSKRRRRNHLCHETHDRIAIPHHDVIGRTPLERVIGDS
jgi:hypothetical protein